VSSYNVNGKLSVLSAAQQAGDFVCVKVS